MVIPSFFIVGAPRCGTSSLCTYLTSHPQVFISTVKEPHHFGADLELRWRPYADRARYLELFARARADQVAGEASVLYLYSKTAPREIQELSLSAKIIIMLRNPLEMVSSLHAHNLILLYEDLADLEEAIAAEMDRRQGRRIPSSCIPSLTLQYTTLGRYAEHVRRYRDTFGPDRVKCVLFEDLRAEPERVYAETLAFLGLEPAGSPDFKAYNTRLRWRSQRMAWTLLAPYRYSLPLGFRLGYTLPTKLLRNSVLFTVALLFALPAKAMVTPVASPPLPPGLKSALRAEFKEDVEQLAEVLGRDLSAWLRPD
jgi:hypothetical protein